MSGMWAYDLLGDTKRPLNIDRPGLLIGLGVDPVRKLVEVTGSPVKRPPAPLNGFRRGI